MGKKTLSQSMAQLLKKPLQRAWIARLMAKFIDFFVLLVLSFFFFPLGMFLGIVYLSIGDSLGMGQSLGKKLMGMRVIRTEDGEKCEWKQAVVRNLPMTAPLMLFVIPILGWLVGGILFLAFTLIEIYLFTTFKSRQRLGDMMAETTVVICGQKPEKFETPETSWFHATNASPCEN